MDSVRMRRRAMIGVAVGVPAAGAGAWLATRLLAERDRQAQASAAIERLRKQVAPALEAMQRADGLAEAVAARDTRALERIMLPLQVTHRLDLVDVVGPGAETVFALRSDRLRVQAQAGKLTDRDAGKWPLTAQTLSGALKPAAGAVPTPQVVRTSWGEALYTAVPVTLNGNVVGAILAGSPRDLIPLP